MKEETKRKISESIKKAYEEGRRQKVNSGCFQVGHKRTPEEESYRISTLPKGIESNAWKGGGSRPYAYNVFRRAGKQKDKCSLCGELNKNKLIIHHVDGNYKNNIIDNLECICYKCHNNSIHNMGRLTQFKKGHKHSPEVLDKIKLKLKGRKQSQETINKRIETMKLNKLKKQFNNIE